MPYLYGQSYSKAELLERVGDISQIGGVKRVTLADGPQSGVEGVEFRTGSGLNFTVLPSRGMDISFAEYNGVPLCWRSSTGEVAPSFYEPQGLGWLRSFYGGLLVTCGMANIGSPCVDQGKELGLHGRVSNIPATNVWADSEWDGDEYIMWAQGKVRETSAFDENLLRTRKIWAKLGEPKIYLHDIVQNQGFKRNEHMYLYHINAGFPVVDVNTKFIAPTLKVIPKDAAAEVEKEKYDSFLPPTAGFEERVYYHDMQEDNDGNVYTALINETIDKGEGFGFYIKYRKSEFPRFIEWKFNSKGAYVVGMEPGNAFVEGRVNERVRGTLQYLEPGEKREYHLEIGVMSSRMEIEEFKERVIG